MPQNNLSVLFFIGNKLASSSCYDMNLSYQTILLLNLR
ncbi:hypothetical Protein YC6258_02586 [Gynuella sunshinyii YC6258]|uniref:Uncharacterized protein n=1 Tax=Gynuella sunshinyii YC6258 TaxID=1445510 RepID=A0A0C5VVY3_9GAMM|nr:hypothetical Protein YC6258_02586 [Gynuella sunshinyii YC6258]